MKKIFFITAVLTLSLSVKAQFVYDYLKGADDYFNKGDYASAAEYYEKTLGKKGEGSENEFKPYTPQNASRKKSKTGTTREMAVYRLAECYRMLNYPSKAETYYKEAMGFGKSQFPLAQYHYATQLRALGNYTEAEENFRTFLAGYATNDTYKKNVGREIDNLVFIQQQLKRKDLKYFTINKAGGNLNTTGASYAPVWVNNNTLLFTSTRPIDSLVKNNKYTNRVFRAVYTEGSLQSVEQANLPQDKNIHQGVISTTTDGNTLFLTRWGVTASGKESAIYTSSKTNDGWSEPTRLDESINAPGFNTQQPFVTADGKYLFFSSNRGGGQGGYDLWYAPLEDGKPGTPVNMGPVINTTYDEQAPFFHTASGSLIFSTNGRTGMGGYDFFQSKGGIGNWSEPINMGYPVNSIKDDIYFISRGPANNILDDVMLSSDRDAACCLELFSLKKIRPLRQISGRVISCDPAKPLMGATVTISDTVNNITILSKTPDATGEYAFSMEDYKTLTVMATAPGFLSKSVQMGTPSNPEDETLRYPDLCLVPEPPKVDEKFVIENVYYDFNKSDLKPESFPALDEIVRMLNTYPEMVIELSAHTDSKGSDIYNLKLSDTRANSVVKYLIEKGIAPERLVAKGYGESQPVEANTIDGKDNPEGRAKNRRTEFKVLKNQ